MPALGGPAEVVTYRAIGSSFRHPCLGTGRRGRDLCNEPPIRDTSESHGQRDCRARRRAEWLTHNGAMRPEPEAPSVAVKSTTSPTIAPWLAVRDAARAV